MRLLVLLPLARRPAPLALDDAGKYPETVGKPFEGVDVRVAGPTGKRHRRPARIGPIWVELEDAVAMSIGRAEIAPARSATTAGPDRRRRAATAGTAPAISASSTRTAGLTITGREDDVVKVDGKRVALGEVEGCLEAFPKIKAAQARVITDDLGGPMVVARVVRASMCRAEDIIDHCARNLAPYKVPRQIEFCESF